MAGNGYEWKLIKYNEEDDIRDIKTTCLWVIILSVLYFIAVVFCYYQSNKAVDDLTSTVYNFSDSNYDTTYDFYNTDGGADTLYNLGQ